MDKRDSNRQVLLSVIGVAILVVAVVGVSFAFFNYTRTGLPNTIKTGTIMFESTQTRINVNNVFPVAASDVATDTENVKTAEVTIKGSTNYTNGIDFIVKAEDVNLTIGQGQSAFNVPLHVTVTQQNLNGVTGLTLGSFDKTNQLANNSTLASGKIPANTEVDGKLLVRVYLDASEIAISDTYPAETTDTNNDGYLDGTPASFGEGRTVLTTEEWNNLSTNSLSFKIRVEANEGA